MTRIDWSAAGQRFIEAGVDRGVLYVAGNPGVPWVGLTAVTHSSSGGEAKPRYLDGIKISNHAEPEELEGTIEAFTHPMLFEQCDGTAQVQNGLRAGQQPRKPFGMVYRTKIGNEIDGLEHAYKIHILYNLRAKPSELGYATLSDENEPMTLSWEFTARGERVIGLAPSAHFSFDTRDIPAALLTELEDVLYGNSEQNASLPTPGELVFLFDSFEDMVYDAGDPFSPVFAIYDAGSPSTSVTDTLDGGTV